MANKRGNPNWKKGVSQNPGGRPKNVTPVADYRRMLDSHIPEILNKAIELAKGGDTTMIKVCLDRVLPAMRPRDEPVELKEMQSISLAEQGRFVLSAMAQGKLNTDEAQSLLSALANQAKLEEATEVVERIERIEEKLKIGLPNPNQAQIS